MFWIIIGVVLVTAVFGNHKHFLGDLVRDKFADLYQDSVKRQCTESILNYNILQRQRKLPSISQPKDVVDKKDSAAMRHLEKFQELYGNVNGESLDLITGILLEKKTEDGTSPTLFYLMKMILLTMDDLYPEEELRTRMYEKYRKHKSYFFQNKRLLESSKPESPLLSSLDAFRQIMF